jgi:hypothetical protein
MSTFEVWNEASKQNKNQRRMNVSVSKGSPKKNKENNRKKIHSMR